MATVHASAGLSESLILSKPLEFAWITFTGACLACAAGFVNGCTLLGFTDLGGHVASFTSSHMTGTTTTSAISLAEEKLDAFGIRLCLIVSFAFGSFLSGAFTSANSKSWEIGPEYAQLFWLLCAILVAACIDAYVDPQSFVYYYLAAMAMGCQNGITSRYSGSLIRTTHVTGTLTDIGLIMGQYTRGVTKDLWKLPVLITLVAAFSIGGLLAVADAGNKLALLGVALFYGLVALFVQFAVARSLGLGIVNLLLGRWDRVRELVQGRREGDGGEEDGGESGSKDGAETAVINPLYTKIPKATYGAGLD